MKTETDLKLDLILPESGSDNPFSKQAVADFLFDHLDQYGDKREDIQSAIDFSMKQNGGNGGFLVVASSNGVIKGAVVVNETGMKGYIPENILVYIAVDRSTRGKGVGRKLMETALSTAKGDVALHVEPENPAKHLYEHLGFKNKYLEMRYKRREMK